MAVMVAGNPNSEDRTESLKSKLEGPMESQECVDWELSRHSPAASDFFLHRKNSLITYRH